MPPRSRTSRAWGAPRSWMKLPDKLTSQGAVHAREFPYPFPRVVTVVYLHIGVPRRNESVTGRTANERDVVSGRRKGGQELPTVRKPSDELKIECRVRLHEAGVIGDDEYLIIPARRGLPDIPNTSGTSPDHLPSGGTPSGPGSGSRDRNGGRLGAGRRGIQHARLIEQPQGTARSTGRRGSSPTAFRLSARTGLYFISSSSGFERVWPAAPPDTKSPLFGSRFVSPAS